MAQTSPVAVVTGGTRGIGRACALALAEAGHRVAILARTKADLNAVAARIRTQGHQALPLAVDVTVEAQVEAAFQRVVDEWSGMDVLVNNAGTGIRKPFAEMSQSECDHLLALNLGGVIICTRAALRHMRPRQHGCIINIASRAALRPEEDMAVYSATKAAVVAFSRALAQEVRDQGIRAVVICPGPVNTARLQQRAPELARARWLQPVDVANAVVFLASEKALRYNGAVLNLYE
jgi:NAD(P)-dependent dehydrogenase (short-subunit alcohol dehydrogenase family)